MCFNILPEKLLRALIDVVLTRDSGIRTIVSQMCSMLSSLYNLITLVQILALDWKLWADSQMVDHLLTLDWEVAVFTVENVMRAHGNMGLFLFLGESHTASLRWTGYDFHWASIFVVVVPLSPWKDFLTFLMGTSQWELGTLILVLLFIKFFIGLAAVLAHSIGILTGFLVNIQKMPKKSMFTSHFGAFNFSIWTECFDMHFHHPPSHLIPTFLIRAFYGPIWALRLVFFHILPKHLHSTELTAHSNVMAP